LHRLHCNSTDYSTDYGIDYSTDYSKMDSPQQLQVTTTIVILVKQDDYLDWIEILKTAAIAKDIWQYANPFAAI